MANDVQNRKRLSAQWNVEHVQGNDAVKLVGAWDCGLLRILWFRVCVALSTTIFTSDIFEHYRFRVSCLQHFQKLSPRWMSQVSMILIHHLGLCLCGTLMCCWLLVLVEPRVFLLLVSFLTASVMSCLGSRRSRWRRDAFSAVIKTSQNCRSCSWAPRERRRPEEAYLWFCTHR